MTVSELCAKRSKLLADVQVIALNENKTSEERARIKTMMDDASLILDDISAAEAAEGLLAAERSSVRPPLANISEATGDSAEVRAAKEKEAFRSYLMHGAAGVKAELQPFLTRAQQEATNGAGGYIVPVGFEKSLKVAQLAWGQALNAVQQITTDSGAPLQWPGVNDTATSSVVLTEGNTVAEADVTFTQSVINVDQFTTGIVRVSNQLLQDSAFDLQEFLNSTFAIRCARGLNSAITLGSSSGNVQGLVGAVSVGTTCPTGETLTIAYTDLVNLHGSVDPAYRVGASWMFNDTVLSILIGLKDTLGRPLFIPSPTSGSFDQILGKPIVINQAMASPAANAKTVMFGDFSNYVLRNVQRLAVVRLNERYADLNQVGFVGFHRQGGLYLNAGTNPIKVLVQSAT